MTAFVNVGDTLVGKYRVDRILGIGGMGMVVAATHLELDQKVAIKFMLPDAAANQQASERFMREARAAVRLRSEHICRVLDVGKLAGGAPYIVMELMEGEDFAQVIRRRGPLPINEAVDFILQGLEGLADAHANKIVHRDLKPGNLFVTSDNDGTPLVKVLDFGISKSTVGGSATKTGEIMGSPAYMSPEQMASSKNVDARADIWAVGVILYQAVTGRMPFDADTLPALCMAVMNETPPAPAMIRGEMPPQLSAVVMKCLEKKPEGRFGNVAELAVTLAPFGGPEAASASRRITKVLGRTTAATPAMAATMGPDTSNPLLAPTMHGDDLYNAPAAIAQGTAPVVQPGRISTLQASASEISFATPAKKRGRGFAIGIVAGLVILGGIGIAVAVGGGGKQDPKPTEPPKVEAKQPDPPKPPDPKPPEVKPPAPPKAPDVAKLTAIDIEPKAAASIAKVTVNKKPFTGAMDFALDPDGTRAVTVSVTASGYADFVQSFDLKAGDNPLTVTLVKHGVARTCPGGMTMTSKGCVAIATTKPPVEQPKPPVEQPKPPVEQPKPPDTTTKPPAGDEIWMKMQHDQGNKKP